MNNYSFENKKFTVLDYNQQSPFANFLPGIAGKMGIPLWVFYTNRGQGISGYGIQDKNHPIMAFTPANKAYEITPITGFRTFIKVNDKVYEPFHIDSNNPHKMTIDFASFSIEQTIKELELKIKVTYFGLVNEPLGGLIRKVELINQSTKSIDVELLDGIAEILPSGIQNDAFKTTSNLLASWADVKHLDKNLAFFTLRASTGDSSEVKQLESGNFYIGLKNQKLIKPIVDPTIIFGENSAKTKANRFINHSINDLIDENQVTTNKFGCAFLPIKMSLPSNETTSWFAISGHAKNFDILQDFSNNIMNKQYIDSKYSEAVEVIDNLTKDVETHTDFPIFDEYIKQNYLDNLIRGGYPEKIGNTVYHLYSRRHGDLERDYNFFSLAPEYYSQGNGNFRDVCQNRRLDSFINKEVEDFNIQHFASLIQLDGYNPLAINGILYQLKDDIDKESLLNKLFVNSKKLLEELFKNPFTPGTIVNFVEVNDIESRVSVKEYLAKIIDHSKPFIQASFGEGFWIDHFTYVLDLVESYQSIYPDKMKDLLFKQKKYYYYDSPISIHKKSEKIVLNKARKIRQYGSLIHFDQEKIEKLHMDPYGSNWVKVDNCKYKSNLFEKLLVLVLNKHSLLDPDGIGVEMEAEKPGWNDAMNGLPGLLGSGVSESIELLRIVDFMLDYIQEGQMELPLEIYELYSRLSQHNNYSERVIIRESYRDSLRFGLSGEKKSVDFTELKKYFVSLKNHIQTAINKLFEEKDGILPTFLRYEVTNYEENKDDSGNLKYHQKYLLVKPLAYKRYTLTPFLEAPARLLKSSFDYKKLKVMYNKIKESGLYDRKLKMYKTSDCLNHESHEIGRIHAFTKGWLERESNFLHMTYKYLLGLLKAELYDEFYEEIKTNLVCFMDPEVYKRSTLENSSFIATSNNPDSSIHGKGYFARLSGSTVEAVNMWTHMMTGGKPFEYKNNELSLSFKPKLHKSFFKNNRIDFNFLKEIKVTYITNLVKNTYQKYDVNKIELIGGGETIEINDSIISGQLAKDVRDGLYKRINIYIN
ncbi:MAG: cellobiose phosphorylase [Candidatus Izimaplasma sp.]|nr:cellobiose phosphorylase [Candidatus Izimaplasma bacterium]